LGIAVSQIGFEGGHVSEDAEGAAGKTRKPWFVRNRSGAGYHPQTWQGWLILLAVVAAIVAIVVLVRTGSL
jgi:hypothetical protein